LLVLLQRKLFGIVQVESSCPLESRYYEHGTYEARIAYRLLLYIICHVCIKSTHSDVISVRPFLRRCQVVNIPISSSETPGFIPRTQEQVTWMSF